MTEQKLAFKLGLATGKVVRLLDQKAAIDLKDLEDIKDDLIECFSYFYQEEKEPDFVEMPGMWAIRDQLGLPDTVAFVPAFHDGFRVDPDDGPKVFRRKP